MVSDEITVILFTSIATYWVLIRSKARIYQLIGCFLLWLIGISAVMVADTALMFLLCGTNLIIGGAHMFEVVSKLVTNSVGK